MKKIVFTVTNDLVTDQRMIRICSSLARAGYAVTLVGRKLKSSPELPQYPFLQKRIRCFFNQKIWFYAEYNLRLFFYLLFKKADCICAIDLDTILPVFLASIIKRSKRVYDAHELFCEMQEIVSRPGVYKIWKRIEKFSVPKFKKGYTVNKQIAEEFKKMYNVDYAVIQNMPGKNEIDLNLQKEKFILYQGAVNEGRSFETLIPAMQFVNAPLWICGEGNFLEQTRKLVQQSGVNDKVFFKGRINPAELKEITKKAWIGLTLFEKKGLSNYYSLANRFFDYIQAGTPQICVDYPAYREINDRFNIALLTDDLRPEAIAQKLNNLLENDVLYKELRNNCTIASSILNWEREEEKLINFYRSILD